MLTELSIKALKPPTKGEKIYTDGSIPGFGVRVTAAGVKSFVLTHGRTRTRETIGRVGILDLKKARAEAKRLLATYTLGRGKVLTTGWILALDAYLKECEERLKNSTHTEYERVLSKYFKFGETKFSDITPQDLQKKLDRIHGSEKRHAYVYLRAFINWAYKRHYIETNPMDRMQAPDGSDPRERVLTDDELKKVWNACEGDYGRIVRFLILTGCRKSEPPHLTVKDGMATLPAQFSKNGREFTFPICAMAHDFVPHRAWGGWSKSKAALDKKSGVTGYTIHDLRRTFASGLQKLGVRSEVIEALLNHTPQGIRAVYQRHNWEAEKREAVTVWEAHLKEIVSVPHT